MTAPMRGPAMRASRIVALVSRPLPPDFVVRSDDLPPAPSRPWYLRPKVWGIDTQTLALDDPDELRRAPIRVTASAFLSLADAVHAHPDRNTRLAGLLLRRWLETDQGRRRELAAALGLKRCGASLRDLDARTEIRSLIVRLAGTSPWRNMAAGDAARSLRAAFERWSTTAGPQYRGRSSTPALAEPALTFWRIDRFALARPMPNEQTIATLIEGDRARAI